MDFFSCYHNFKNLYHEVIKTQRPVLVEVMTQRFKGHSISDPGLYRSKDELESCVEQDPIRLMKSVLMEKKWLTEEEYKALDKELKQLSVEAMKFAEESPWPDTITLEEDVFAP